MRDWKLESLAKGKEISAVPFRTEFPENYLTIWLQTEISGLSRQMVSTLCVCYLQMQIADTLNEMKAMKLWETPGVSNRTQSNTDHSTANLNWT